ncbi:hypothetical protein [Niveibacterium sp.]
MRNLMRKLARLLACLHPTSEEERYLASAADAHELEARQRRIEKAQR